MSIDNSFSQPPDAQESAARRDTDNNLGRRLFADPKGFQQAHSDASSAANYGAAMKHLPDVGLLPGAEPAERASPPARAGTRPEVPSANALNLSPTDQSNVGPNGQHEGDRNAAASTAPHLREQAATVTGPQRPGDNAAAIQATPRPTDQARAIPSARHQGDQAPATPVAQKRADQPGVTTRTETLTDAPARQPTKTEANKSVENTPAGPNVQESHSDGRIVQSGPQSDHAGTVENRLKPQGAGQTDQTTRLSSLDAGATARQVAALEPSRSAAEAPMSAAQLKPQPGAGVPMADGTVTPEAHRDSAGSPPPEGSARVQAAATGPSSLEKSATALASVGTEAAVQAARKSAVSGGSEIKETPTKGTASPANSAASLEANGTQQGGQPPRSEQATPPKTVPADAAAASGKLGPAPSSEQPSAQVLGGMHNPASTPSEVKSPIEPVLAGQSKSDAPGQGKSPKVPLETARAGEGPPPPPTAVPIDGISRPAQPPLVSPSPDLKVSPIATPTETAVIAHPAPLAAPGSIGEPTRIALSPSAPLDVAKGPTAPNEPGTKGEKEAPKLVAEAAHVSQTLLSSDRGQTSTAGVDAHAPMVARAGAAQPIESAAAKQLASTGTEQAQAGLKPGDPAVRAVPPTAFEREKTGDVVAGQTTNASPHALAEVTKLPAAPEAAGPGSLVHPPEASKLARLSAEPPGAATVAANEAGVRPGGVSSEPRFTTPAATEGTSKLTGTGAPLDAATRTPMAAVQPTANVNVVALNELKKSNSEVIAAQAPRIVGNGTFATATLNSDRLTAQGSAGPTFGSLAKSSIAADSHTPETKGQVSRVSALPPNEKAIAAPELPVRPQAQTIVGEKNSRTFNATSLAASNRGESITTKQLLQTEKGLLPSSAFDGQTSHKPMHKLHNAVQTAYFDATANRRAETPVLNPSGMPGNSYSDATTSGAKSPVEAGRSTVREIPAQTVEVKKSIAKPETSLDSTNTQPQSTHKAGLPSLTTSSPINTKQAGSNTQTTDPSPNKTTSVVPISVTTAMSGLPTVSIQQDPNSGTAGSAARGNQLPPCGTTQSNSVQSGTGSSAHTPQQLPTNSQTVSPNQTNSPAVTIPVGNSSNNAGPADPGTPNISVPSNSHGSHNNHHSTHSVGTTMPSGSSSGEGIGLSFGIGSGTGIGFGIGPIEVGLGSGTGTGSGIQFGIGPIEVGLGSGPGSGIQFGIGPIEVSSGARPGSGIQFGIGPIEVGLGSGPGSGIQFGIGPIEVGLGSGPGSGIQPGIGTGSGASSGGSAGALPGSGSIVDGGIPGNIVGTNNNTGNTLGSVPSNSIGIDNPVYTPSNPSNSLPSSPSDFGTPPDLGTPSNLGNSSGEGTAIGVSAGNGGTIDSQTYSPSPDANSLNGTPQSSNFPAPGDGNSSVPNTGYPGDPSLPIDPGYPSEPPLPTVPGSLSSGTDPGEVNGAPPGNPLIGSVQYSDGFDFTASGASSGTPEPHSDQTSNPSVDPNQPFGASAFGDYDNIDSSWQIPGGENASQTSTVFADSSISFNPNAAENPPADHQFSGSETQSTSSAPDDLTNFANSNDIGYPPIISDTDPASVNIADSESQSPQIDNQIAFAGALDGVPMLQGEGSIPPTFDNSVNQFGDPLTQSGTTNDAPGTMNSDSTDLVNFDGNSVPFSQDGSDGFGSGITDFDPNRVGDFSENPMTSDGARDNRDGSIPDDQLAYNQDGIPSPWASDQPISSQDGLNSQGNIRDDQSLLVANDDSGPYRPQFDQTPEVVDEDGFSNSNAGSSNGLDTSQLQNPQLQDSDSADQLAPNLDAASDGKTHSHDEEVDLNRARIEEKEKRDRELAEFARLTKERQAQLADRQQLQDEAQQLLSLLIAEEDKAKQDNKQEQYRIRKGDTLEGIALLKLKDAKLAHLIYALNKAKIGLEYADGKPLYKLQQNSVIWLPSPRQVREWRQDQAFNPLLNKSPAAKKLSEKNRKEAAERRANIEKYLGTLAEAVSEGTHSRVNVRLGDTLRSIAVNHPMLQDVSLWPLLAKINGLSSEIDNKGTPVAQIRRGTSLLLPTPEEIATFKKRMLSDAQPSARLSKYNATTQMTVITGNKGQPAFQLRAENLDQIEQKWVHDTIIGSLVEKLGDSCRIVKSAGSGGTSHLMRSQLEVLTGNTWVPILTYEISDSNSLRFELDENGNRVAMPIDLPASTVEEMMANDMHDNWRTYAGNYLRRKI
jgi:hypothetical protein